MTCDGVLDRVKGVVLQCTGAPHVLNWGMAIVKIKCIVQIVDGTAKGLDFV